MKYKYTSFKEAEASGAINPVLRQIEEDWGITFLGAFTARYDDRFIAYPQGYTELSPVEWLSLKVTEITALYREWYQNKKQQIEDAISESIRDETVTRKRFDAPDGDPNTAYVVDMEQEVRDGGRDNLVHIAHLNELENLDAQALSLFNPLFLGVFE